MLFNLDTLESRRLLAGVTLLTHGYQGNITGWVGTAARDIAARLGGSDFASIYSMTVAKSGKSLAVTSFAPDSGQKDYRQTLDGELILKLDWSSVSSGSYTTQDVAAVVNQYLLTAHGKVPPLAQLPLHLIGHSRGASLVSALSQDLGKSGVWVDQMTSLDPHPVDGVNDFLGVSFGDAKMASYDNVAFADDYWRTDGNPNNSDFDGEPVTGAHQGDLNNSVQQNFFVSAHIAVTAYYVGTINTTTLDGGDHPVIPSWYGSNAATPSRTSTGFAFSTIGGTARPADGVSTLLGGTGKRVAAGESGSQWANGFGLSLGATSVSAGQTFEVSLKFADRDSKANVGMYLDQDQNPYDGAGALTSKPFDSSTLTNGRVTVPTAGLRAGTYYIAAATTDSAGHTRWSYSPTKIKISAPDFAQLKSGVLTVTGTDGNDKISIYPSGPSIVAILNGATQTFSNSAVTSIEIYGGSGADAIDASGMTRAIYALGGPGQDIIVGGSGNDTLSGGAQSNTLIGGEGDDALNGSPGNDLIEGNGGNDRLYSNGGLDTLSGGANVDRLFGGDGLDYMVGGSGNDKLYGMAGNDTLIGGEGSDILDGGTGTNTSENDVLDLRSNIDILLPI